MKIHVINTDGHDVTLVRYYGELPKIGELVNILTNDKANDEHCYKVIKIIHQIVRIDKDISTYAEVFVTEV